MSPPGEDRPAGAHRPRDEQRPGYEHLAALGSSFAAGPDIPPVVDRAAGRSGRNYPHLLAALLGARLTDLTVSGATTDTVLTDTQRRRRREFRPQLEGLPRDADLVTLTAGGNDLGYIGGLTAAARAGTLRRVPALRPAGERWARAARPRIVPEDLHRVAARLAGVVEAVRTRAPRARVVLVDYVTVLGPASRPSPGLPLRDEEIHAFRDLAAAVDEVLADAAHRSGADLVAASAVTRGHELGAAEPWVTGFRVRNRPLAFHPTADAMSAVADAVFAHLRSAR